MEQAIKKAIEGGFTEYPSAWDLNKHFVVMYDEQAVITQNPLFWQALSKQQDWATNGGEVYDGYAWLKKWHLFIDHLAEGKPIDDFFTSLLEGKS